MKKCDCLLPDCAYCYPGTMRRTPFDEMRRSHKSTKRSFINIYEDKQGRFLSGCDYTTYKDAYESRDNLSTYIETVEIIRIKKTNKK